VPRATWKLKTIAAAASVPHQDSRALLELLEGRLMMARTPGVDVSQFQGSISWGPVYTNGKRFAFIRASRSNLDKDPTLDANMFNAKSAGLVVGPYHRVLPLSTGDAGPPVDPLVDAQRYVNAAGQYMTTGYLRPVVDVEDGSTLGRTALSKWVRDFIGEVKRLTGVDCMIYCNSNFAINYLDSTVTTQRLWIANWTTTTYGDPVNGTGSPPLGAWNTAGKTWDFWQYSSSGVVPGIPSGVDLDVFNGDLATLQSTRVILPPEITVLRGGSNIADGQATAIDFGAVQPGATAPTVTFTVRNDGESALTLGSLILPSGYSVADPLATTLLAGQSDTFTIRLDTAAQGTKSGQISFSNNDPSESPFNFPITGVIDGVAPTVDASSFDYQSSSRPVQFAFSENVQASLSTGDLTVIDLATSSPVSISGYSYDAGANTVTFGLPPLADGNYRATLAAAGVTDRAGNALAADAVLDFFVLAGDANHDRSIDTLDFNALAGNFGGSAKTYAQGDFNYDGVVDTLDFNTLAGQFGKALSPMVSSADHAGMAPFAQTLFSNERLVSPDDRLIANLI
jgi:GH25 family lysozyme M1 (1,4-beta-N-acetylmuramidase)